MSFQNRAVRLLTQTVRRKFEQNILRILVVLVLNGTSLQAQRIDSLPGYQAEQQVSGTIRIWGYGNGKRGTINRLLASWEEGFRKYQPGIHFDTQLFGNASAIGGLYTGAADLAFMTRDIEPTEVDGYQQALGHEPFQVSVLTRSLDAGNEGVVAVIFVHKDNPLARLTLAQLDAIFSADHRRGPNKIRLWGELGLTGEWADRPINLYGYNIASDASQFFEQAVMVGSEKWNCCLQEFSDLHGPDGNLIEAGRQILDALAKDRYGIAIATLSHKNPLTKPLPLALEEGGPYYAPSKDTAQERTYPLARAVSIFMNRVPGQPLNPNQKEFLSYILSWEGQAAALRHGGYLPLAPQLAQQERRKME